MYSPNQFSVNKLDTVIFVEAENTSTNIRNLRANFFLSKDIFHTYNQKINLYNKQRMLKLK